jgi:anti-sigma B factor antagonist
MIVEIDKQEKYTLVSIKDQKLTSQNAPDLKSQFTVIHGEGEKNIILDLGNVEYCDSSGLSAILQGNRFCKSSSGTFVISGVKETVQKIIAISQLDKVLSITPTVSEAVDLVHMDEVERDLMNE